jgi:hypothetical protein
MRCSLKLLVPVMVLAAPAVALAQSQPRFNLGSPLSKCRTGMASSRMCRCIRRSRNPAGGEVHSGAGAKGGACARPHAVDRFLIS